MNAPTLPIAPWQLKKLHALLTKLGFMDEKALMVRHYTEGRTTSSREMYYSEAMAMIASMEEQMDNESRSKRERIVRKMLYYGYQLGWGRPRTSQDHGIKASTLCYRAIESWAKSDRCAVSKSLRDMTAEELAKALSQLQIIYRKSIQTTLPQ